MNKKLTIFARAFDRETGEPRGEERGEEIDTSTNEIDVKKAFEAFWNDLNPHSSEIVFVQRIDVE